MRLKGVRRLMGRIVIYALAAVIAIISGCAGKKAVVPSPAPPPAEEVVAAGRVKQPLYKKPDFKARETVPESDPVETRLTLARKYLDEKQYDKIPPVLEEIAGFDPANEEAVGIADQAYYEMGRSFYNGRQYIASRDALSRVPPDYKDTASLLASVRAIIDKQAEDYYKRGVKYYINEELENAISEWEKTLALNPGHLRAGEDIENARQLLKKLNTINKRR